MTGEITHTGQTVRVATRVSVPVERVWQAWTDPEHVARWFADRAEGKCEPGSVVTWTFERFDMSISYRVLEADVNRRLVLGSDVDAVPFKLEVLLEQLETETVIRVINSGLPEDDEDSDQAAGVESGWQMALGILKHYIENYWGKDRRSFFAVREATFEYDQLITFYREEFKLAQWLTTDGAIIEGKPSVRLVLRDGRSMSGAVIAETPREIALAWDEIDGVVEFKGISIGPGQRAVCVRGCGWGLSQEEARVIEGSMESALERLVAVLEE